MQRYFRFQKIGIGLTYYNNVWQLQLPSNCFCGQENSVLMFVILRGMLKQNFRFIFERYDISLGEIAEK